MIIIATSLSLIILGTGICSALGIDLWTMVVEWTQEYLLMSMKPATEFPDETEMPGADLPQSRENVWGTELYDLMEEHEIYVQLPLWKPEGYELVDIKSVNNSEQQYTLLSAEYESKEGGIFAVLIREFKAPAALENLTGWLEADENLQESFKQGEKTYYIVNNFDHFSFTWNDRMYNIHISGDISYETIMQMIASLHQSEEENS